MSSPYQPEPGCTARQRQLEQQVHDLRQQLRAAEDELGEVRQRLNNLRRQTHELGNERDQFAAGLPLVCSDDRHEAKVRGLEQLLTAGQNAAEHWEGAYTREVAAHGQTEHAARRHRLAWQSARRRAAAAEARVAELETDDGDWLGGWPYGPLLPLFVPEQLGAAFGDGGQTWWAVAIDERRQRELVKQRLAEHLAANPVPGPELDRDRLREQVSAMIARTWTKVPAQSRSALPVSAEPFPGLNFDDMATLINEYRMPEQPAVPRREMQRSEPSSTGLTVVTTDPVQEIAAEPATLDALKRRYFAEPVSRLGAQVGQIGQFFGFPMIPDADLPPGEVHMRPHPQTTEGRP